MSDSAGKHSGFVHLRVHSSYSLSEGAIKCKDIAALAKNNKMPAVGIADNGNLFGSLEFSTSCAKSGIQPIIGCSVNISDNDKKLGKLLLIAKDDEGYKNLLYLVSHSFLDTKDVANPQVTLARLKEKSEGIIALTGGPRGVIGQALLSGNHEMAQKLLKELKEIFKDRIYIEIMRQGMPDENKTENFFIDFAYGENLPLVATNDVYFSDKAMFEAADALLCIAHGRYVNEEVRPRFSNEQYFKTAEEMKELFSDLPEALENTTVIAKRCSVMARERPAMLPTFPTENGRSEEEELRMQAKHGLQKRLAGVDELDARPYYERLEFELGVIIGMKFPGYFLIVSDFIKWSKEKGIPVGPGRGSGAGSVVAWALEITNLDPLRFGLLFERFLNPERISMPDFDIDFCQERRDEVIDYVRRNMALTRWHR